MACSDLNISNPTGPTNTIRSPICIDPQGGAAKIMGTVIPLLLIAAVIISFFMLLWGGIQYTTSGGSEENIAKAKGRIIYAIIGLVVSFLSLVIFMVLGNILGFKLII